jgi:hypothetical protein
MNGWGIKFGKLVDPWVKSYKSVKDLDWKVAKMRLDQI